MNDQIEKYIEENDMTVRELAEKVGASESTVSNWKNGATPAKKWQAALSELGLTFEEPWFERDSNRIAKLYRTHSVEEIARILNRTPQNVAERLESSRDISRWMIKKSDLSSGSRHHFFGNLAEVEKALDLLDQIDEPEVLSQELPVIPSYVAEYLKLAKSDVSLMRVLEIANRRDELPKWEKEYAWISANHEKFARAWLDGYKVAVEEPLYYALVKGHELIDDFNHWSFDTLKNVLFVGSQPFKLDGHLVEMSKSEWSKLGINDSNADFVKVGDVEE